MDNTFLDVVSPIQQKIPALRNDTVSVYILPKSKDGRYIFFNKDQLMFMYHLVRFNYFDRDIAEKIYYTLTRKEKLSSRWFQKLIGNRSYPISIYDKAQIKTTKKVTSKKIYYVNKKFASWLFEQINEHEDLLDRLLITEYDNSMHSIVANNLFGGKPSTVNYHDYTIRSLVASYAYQIVKQIPDDSTENINIQFSFPVNKQITTLLPDSTIFVYGKAYHFEYDNDTEQQYRLLSKVIRYIENSPFHDTNIYFIFNVVQKKNDLSISKRITTFLKNIETNNYHEQAFIEHLETEKIGIYGYPEFQSINQVAQSILIDLGIYHYSKPNLDMINNFSGLPYLADEIDEVPDGDFFDYYVRCQNDDFELITIPLIHIDYGKVGNDQWIKAIKKKYKDSYEHIGLVYSGQITTQFQMLDDDFFISLYLA